MDASTLIETFPLMRVAGVLLLLVGLGTVAGGLVPARRTAALAAGTMLGVVAVVVALATGWGLDGVDRPAWWQWAGLVAAVLLGAAGVVAVLRRPDDRERLLLALVVMGTATFVLTVAGGPVCGVVGFLLTSNVALVWLLPSVEVRQLWTADGSLKAVAGVVMVAVAL